MKLENVHFLIVEDDDVDIMSLKRILINVDKEIDFSVCYNGEEALEFLKGEAEDQDPVRDKQIIILLDINMPKMSGHEFLDALRADENLRDTIVFVLSTSNDPIDIRKSYNQLIAGYIPKDRLNVDNFRALMENFIDLVVLPGVRPANKK